MLFRFRKEFQLSSACASFLYLLRLMQIHWEYSLYVGPMKKHPKTHHRCYFDDFGNNLKVTLNATSFFSILASGASGSRLHQSTELTSLVHTDFYLYRVLESISIYFYLYQIIFSFYLQNVYVFGAISIDLKKTSYGYDQTFLTCVCFYASFWFLLIQTYVFCVIQTFRQSFSKWIIILLSNFFFTFFIQVRTMNLLTRLYHLDFFLLTSVQLKYQLRSFDLQESTNNIIMKSEQNQLFITNIYIIIFKIKYLMLQKKYLASLDQSTTTTKFSIYHFDGKLVDQQIVSHKQISQHEGWLEHDPIQINQSVNKSIQAVIQRMKHKQQFKLQQILGLGICNQRETVVCWDAETLKPFYNAIVWCDARTKDICQKFKNKYNNFSNKTGLPVSTYFSLFKILWLIQNVEGLKQKIKQGKVRFGTIDTWVTLMLTGKYVTDASNASRTHLIDISTGKWDKELLDIAQITQIALPKIIGSFQQVGQIVTGALKGVSVRCILGDQQSSAYAHNLSQTQMKITYGTGCFMLNNIGLKPIFNDSFVTTILFQNHNQRAYGFQVSVQCGGGTINWAKKAGFLNNYEQLNNLGEFQENLFFMPSFGSIFSPYWKTDVQGGVIGLNFSTTKQNILRALLQSITYRLFDNIRSQKFQKVTKIIVDGGMTVNKQFMQMQADMFNKQIEVRSLDTCWGVAKGVLTSSSINSELAKFQCINYKPTNKHEQYVKKYQKWSQARKKFYGWH